MAVFTPIQYTVYSPPSALTSFLQGLYNNKYDTFKPPCIFTPTKDIHLFIILREPQQVPPGFLLSILKGGGGYFLQTIDCPPPPRPPRPPPRKWMEREAKAKVVASVCGAEFVQFLAALAVFPQSI